LIFWRGALGSVMKQIPKGELLLEIGLVLFSTKRMNLRPTCSFAWQLHDIVGSDKKSLAKNGDSQTGVHKMLHQNGNRGRYALLPQGRLDVRILVKGTLSASAIS
jgi:hypothetical protein